MEDGGNDILQAAEAGSERARAEVEAAPKLTSLFHFQAFNDLSTLRQMGMALGPIPIDKIEWYALQLEMDLIEQVAFEYVMRAVDVAYLTKQAEKRAKSARQSK